MRKKEQEFWDKVAILKLFDAVNKVGEIDGNLKVQKLMFLYELKGQEEGLEAAHYRFFRYNLGPYSKDLANDIAALEELGFVTKRSRRLTRRGQFLLEYIAEHINASQEARRAFEMISEISQQYGKYSGPRLTDMVYAMKVPVHDLGAVERIRAVPALVDILDPVSTPALKEVHPFKDDLLRDLEEEFSIPLEDLTPSSRSFRTTVANALARISSLE